LTPFWIKKKFVPSEVPKCLLQQVQNEFICKIRMRNGCVRAKRKKQWLMAPSKFAILKFRKKIFDLAMENLCLAAILIFSAILFFFIQFFFFFL
jgi:hypothetical protein